MGASTKRRRICTAAALVGLTLAAATSNATIVVETYGPFTCHFYGYNDSNGQKTGALDWTAQQRTDVQAGIAAWDSTIANQPGRQVVMHLFWENMGGSTLGGSYSPSNGDGTNAWTYGEHVWRDGVNYQGPWDGWDTQISYDVDAASYGWNFGAGAPGVNEIDFRSVVTHEIGHSIGFYDTYYPLPYDDWGNTWGTDADPYAWAGYEGLTAWDQNLVDDGGNRPEIDSKGTPGNFGQTDDPVYWDGAEAVTYYGDQVPIYAPKPFQSGSSLAHLDGSLVEGAGFPAPLMGPFITLGEMNRAPTDLEWAMMRDMGWQVGQVPEPSSWVMLTGLAAISLLWRRARRKRPA